MIIGWLLRFLLLICIARAVWRFVAGLVEGMQATPRSAGPAGQSPVALVRDPICGVYVVPSRAIALGRGAGAQYFCSKRCRDQYRAGRAISA
jgi:YHS domain-containing protein